MLRLSVKSYSHSLAIDGGSPTRQVSADAEIPEGIEVNGSIFSGPVHIVISDQPIDAPFQHGSIYWDVNAFGEAFAALWVFAPAEAIDRIYDMAAYLQQINVSAAGLLVNGGIWPDPRQPAAVSRFACVFGKRAAV
ncbi:MAG: hypothetical protein J0H95_07185 [Xanthomonadales bacterium]|nr:hypothetical protein [Xanthomonadales bacterium]